MESKILIRELESILALAAKGERYDEMRKELLTQIDEIKKKSKTQLSELQRKYWKLYEENNLLKSTHQDWITEMCPDCNGAGGFDDGQGGGEACHCDGGTIYTIKDSGIYYCPKCGEIMPVQDKDTVPIVSCCNRSYPLSFAQVRFQKKEEYNQHLVCNYYQCSDSEDRQFPNCDLFGTTECGLHKYQEIQKLLNGDI